MAQPNANSGLRCFLCRRKGAAIKNGIDVSTCPASRKPVRDVLKHLARISGAELYLSREDWLCHNCHVQLVDYDANLMKVLRQQRRLSQLVEKAASSVADSDCERECDEHMATLEELNDDQFFDDVNISEEEISRAMREASVSNDDKKSKREENHSSGRRTHPQQFYRTTLKARARCPCNFCAMRFESKERLRKHVAQAHKKFCCDQCSYSHRNEDYVVLHQNVHEGKTECQCRFCEKEFSTKISTIRHMEVHFDYKKYQCDKCGLCFSQTTTLYNHKLQHEAEENPLRCEVCNQVFKTKRTFRHHMITHRADRPRYSCEFCAKTFTEKYTLKVHRRTHPEVAAAQQILEAASQQQQQQQQQLQAMAQEQQQLQQQTEPSSSSAVAAAVASISQVQCIICDLPCASKDSLNKHMEKDHDVITKSLTLTNFSQYEVVTDEPKRACHICGHMFSTQANLDYHLEHVHGMVI